MKKKPEGLLSSLKKMVQSVWSMLFFYSDKRDFERLKNFIAS
jgi:hypothetical protein